MNLDHSKTDTFFSKGVHKKLRLWYTSTCLLSKVGTLRFLRREFVSLVSGLDYFLSSSS